MNPTTPYDHHDQQQQAYGTRRLSTSALLTHKSNGSNGSTISVSSANLTQSTARPLPRTPALQQQQLYQQQQQQQYLDSSMPNDVAHGTGHYNGLSSNT